ncbi:MAG TPA: signal peptidase II [Patescibacteria group bacterium]|nr:signal peptidase II [Patescibacteria group bacterium]
MPKKFQLYLLVSFLLFTADRLTKYLSLKKLPGEGVFLTDYFKLRAFFNPNISLGLPLPNLPAVILTVAIIGLLIYLLAVMIAKKTPGALAVILMLTGAFGNLLDRLRFGAIVDFIDFNFFPAFNLADAYIVIGALLLIFNFSRNPRYKYKN